MTGNVRYDPSAPGEDKPAVGWGEDYKLTPVNTGCRNVSKINYEDVCLPFMEKTCYTQQVESCNTLPFANCSAITAAREERKCFNVTELVCTLEERTEYDPVEEEYTVQKCTEILGRVCDSVYDLTVSNTDDYQCLDLASVKCDDEDRVIKDIVCKFTVSFDCKSGTVNPDGSPAADDCTRNAVKNCYEVPRTVKETVCRNRTGAHCEKLTNEVLHPVQKQACHGEPMKTCELETRTRMKNAKRYVYNKSCKSIPREVCDNVVTSSLKQVCDMSSAIKCEYTPVESCQDVEKQYCYKKEIVTTEVVCSQQKTRTFTESKFVV